GRGTHNRDRHQRVAARPDRNPLISHRSSWEDPMKRADLTEKLLDVKREKGWTWKFICEQIGGMSPVMIIGALLGNLKLTKPQAAAAAKLFGHTKPEQAMLNDCPNRDEGD